MRFIISLRERRWHDFMIDSGFLLSFCTRKLIACSMVVMSASSKIPESLRAERKQFLSTTFTELIPTAVCRICSWKQRFFADAIYVFNLNFRHFQRGAKREKCFRRKFSKQFSNPPNLTWSSSSHCAFGAIFLMSWGPQPYISLPLPPHEYSEKVPHQKCWMNYYFDKN